MRAALIDFNTLIRYAENYPILFIYSCTPITGQISF